jgi:DNA polymerase-3 subunit epsilon
MPIPKECSEIHGIYDEDVKDAPTFKEIAPKVMEMITGADLGGFNSNRFDVPLLAEELLRAEFDFDLNKFKLVDAQTIFFKRTPKFRRCLSVLLRKNTGKRPFCGSRCYGNFRST